MKTDLFTKTLLTLTTVFLGMIALHPAPPVRADNAPPIGARVFDPQVRQLEIPGRASVPGRIAIDLRNGNVYGFPTSTLGYPRTVEGDKFVTSQPVLLSRFDLNNLRH
jgi:hypothetical protein